MNKKRIISLFLILLVIVSISSTVFGGTFGNMLKTDGTLGSSGEVKDKIKDIIGIVQVIAVGMTVVMLLALGIRFMYASVSDRAEIKKNIMVYIVGATFVFGTTGLLQIVKAVVDESFK